MTESAVATITLSNVVPDVYAARPDEVRGSDVWATEVTFERGRIYCVEAASGRGKSTLCAFLYGMRRDFTGTIALDGTDYRTMSVADLCRLRQRHIAYLPQDLALFDELTVAENIDLKNDLTHHCTRQEIAAMLHTLGVADLADRPVATLSVGQQQRVAAVRALCQPFDFILLDEPVSHIDEANNRALGRLVVDEARRRNAAVIVTSVGNRLILPNDAITTTLHL